MRKKMILFLIIICLSIPAFTANTVTIQISCTIPEHISTPQAAPQDAAIQPCLQEVTETTNYDTFAEKILRGNEFFLLQTTVVK